jgi:hypothetical protein
LSDAVLVDAEAPVTHVTPASLSREQRTDVSNPTSAPFQELQEETSDA